jgi:hypothetical protein
MVRGEIPGEFVQFTCRLIPSVAQVLADASTREGLSRTDITNRALQVYSFLLAESHAGSDLLIRRPGDELMLVRLF